MHISVFDPASPEAGSLLWLWNATMYVCGFILAVVTVSIAYIVMRFRRRDDREPDQITGNRKLEIAWTAIPLALVMLLFALSIFTARAVDRPIRRAPDVVITGMQWWWQIDYPASRATTANEMHIPVGRDVLVDVEAGDVIHNFWVPRLARKIDAIPGRPNYVWIHANEAGVFDGVCSEYCGAQHAWMRFQVIAQDEASYEAWVAGQAAPAQEPAAAQAKFGRARFGELTCANCHNIEGLNRQRQYGPDLTHVASRRMLAAGRLENTPANLKGWLREPDVLKPGSNMPNFKLSDRDLAALTAFLETLK